MNIEKQIDNKTMYMDLLLDADPSERLVKSYLSDCDMFVLKDNNIAICIAVVIKIDDDIVELKNLVTKKEYRSKGYASLMIKYLFNYYKDKYNKIIVGTSENNIPFYNKQGFDKYEKTIKNFFIDNYDEEIIDNGFKCIDMCYYSKKL